MERETKMVRTSRWNSFWYFSIIALLLAGWLCLGTACGSSEAQNGEDGAEYPEVTDTGFYLDTTVTITLYDWSDPKTIQKAFDEIARLERLLSVEMDGSDAANISENAGVQPVAAAPETLEVLKSAQKYASLSGGKFDVTIGPLVSLWDIHDGSGYVPTVEERQNAQRQIDYRKLSVKGDTVFLEDAGMKMNLGAIAKGYIADRVKALLQKEGVKHAVINLGGNVAVIGKKPDGHPFCIGIQDPLGNTGEIIGALEVADGSLVSSGNYERYFEQNGVRYHHILDPDSGAPAETGLSGVTVLTEKSVDGDALSTTLFLLGMEQGKKLIESIDGAEALFVDQSGTIMVTDGLEGKLIVYE